MHIVTSLFLALLSALFVIPAPLSAQEASRTILVLDASGSMWGQIDGKAKITIAQEVIGDLLQSLPGETELGLTVYGHRRKGDCSDIETLILPGGDTRAAIGAAVNGIKPKGKTPLSAAVIAAAKALNYTEERATVILVSDGKETCNLNTCEVGRQLAEAGVDFTAHVIGFDVTDPLERAELQCLATETGGTFRTASNAAELGQALAVVAEPEPTPEPAPAFDLTFIATQGDGGPTITQGISWSLGTSPTGPFVAQSQAGPSIGFAAIPQGTPLFVQVVRQQDGAIAELTLVVDANTPETSILVLPDLPPEPQALRALAREEETDQVIDIAMNWTITGPDGAVLIDNQLMLRPDLQVPPGLYQITVTRPEDGATATRQFEVGDLPLQAVLKLPMIVVPAPLTLNAREEGVNGMIGRDLVWSVFDAQGAMVLDHVTGSTASTSVLAGSYRVEVLRPVDEHTVSQDFVALRDGTTITVTFPPYLPPATLAAVDTAAVGSDITVDWTGPNEARDFVTVTRADAPGYTYQSYQYTSEGTSVTLTMPPEPGRYELRYVMNESMRVLARRTIDVTPVEATLQAADSAAAGAGLSVEWTGPGHENDYVAVAKIGAPETNYINYAYTNTGTPVTVQMPTEPGEYELRYVMASGPVVLATRPINVGKVTASLTAPASGVAGASISVQWTGPGYKNDYITVAQAGAPDKKYTTYTYTRDGSPLQLALPLTPGAYELRYVMGQDLTVAARVAISITPASASLEAPTSVAAGSQVAIAWTGPDYRNDFVSIAEIGSRDSKYLTYAYTKRGSPASVQVPSQPGSYELRYVAAGTPQTVLVRRTLEVTEVSAKLQAAPTAAAGGTIMVTWDGPNYRNDYIALSKVGDKAYETYAYTRTGTPVTLKVPETPGAYELRYVIDQDHRVIARVGLTVQ